MKPIKIYIGLVILLCLSLLSFSINDSGLSWMWSDSLNMVGGFMISIILLVIIMRKAKKEEEYDAELKLKRCKPEFNYREKSEEKYLVFFE